MNQEVETEIINQFEVDVLEGLGRPIKTLPSKYFYDAKGDQLFQQIMKLDEYYLTRKELSIFENQCTEIFESIDDGEPFRIIELGAGDGLKTKVLLKHFIERGADFVYSPVDISANVLDQLRDNLMNEIPNLKFEPFVGDYFEALADVADRPYRDIVYFLGSNVGNFPDSGEVDFLRQLARFMNSDDLLFMGVDLKKDPQVILNAYNDPDGITREFNLNLLDRINSELGADFDRRAFEHYPTYNPQTGECQSYLVSKVAQVVHLANSEIQFLAGEPILMEVSKKFDFDTLKVLSEDAGFSELNVFTDDQNWFVDVIWKRT